MSDVYFNVSMKIIEAVTFQINSFTFIYKKYRSLVVIRKRASHYGGGGHIKKNDEKLPYLHNIAKRKFLVSN